MRPPTSGTPPATLSSITTLYRTLLRLSHLIPPEPTRPKRSLRNHVHDNIASQFGKYRNVTAQGGEISSAELKNGGVAVDTQELERIVQKGWREARALEKLVSGEAMKKYPLSPRLLSPPDSPSHYTDLYRSSQGETVYSRLSHWKQWLFKYLRLKI
ncbi:hypothetical protein BKA69DRAFT_1126655 [Paraphysoderma sedebokerense]|nr:hypothetical protein BKA69DRAFT_1126655 [Paraphysoderma sedebokerense]